MFFLKTVPNHVELFPELFLITHRWSFWIYV